MFDELEALAAPKASDLRSEIDRYLSTDVEDVRDAVMWWTERKSMFPILSRMALDYLTIPGECSHRRHFPLVSQRFPATSVDVERVFSRGRLVLSHTRSRLATQTIRAVLCLGPWSLLHLIRDSDVKAVSQMPDVEEGLSEEDQLEKGWDHISKST
jgi:hypothetical protein